MKRTAWHLNVLLSLCCFGILQAQRSSVYFGRNTFDLDARARFKVDSLAHVASSASVISLQGFCDSVGSSAFNDALAMKRVQAVRERMIADGIPAGKIRVQALGERGAINKNLDEHERAMNRRVTIDLIRAGSTHPAASAPVEKVQIVITGTVTNENKEPAQAEISLYDLEGRQVKSTTCDELGTYAMVVKVDRGQDYFLYYYNDSAFIASTTVNASNAAKPFSNLRTVLPSLKKGSKYQLGNLNFMGGSPQLLPSSRPSLEALHKLMKKNPDLTIRIEGHVNNPTSLKIKNPNSAQHNQWLSEARARTVYNYLLRKNIDKGRMSTAGYGDSQMLFPDAITEEEMMQNRRVEIKVVSFGPEKSQ